MLARRDRGAISVYARGRDYHDMVKPRLKRLGRWLVAETGAAIKVFVDTAPVMEKPLAQAAGLGWQGKHTNLLGARARELVLPRGDLHHAGAAAGCRGRGALRVVPGLPRRLPDRGAAGAVPARCAALHQLPDHRARRAGRRGAAAADGQPHLRLRRLPRGLPVEQVRGDGAGGRLPGARGDWTRRGWPSSAALDDAGFRAMFRGSPIKRIGRDRFVRNVGYAIGNSGDPALLPAARRLAADARPGGARRRRLGGGAAQLSRCRLARASGARALSGWRSISSSQTALAPRARRSRRARRRSRTAPRAGRDRARGRARASASAAAGSSWWRSVAARSAWASASSGSAARTRLERGPRRRPVASAAAARASEELAVGVGGGHLVGLGERGAGEVGPAGGEPLRGRRRRGSTARSAGGHRPVGIGGRARSGARAALAWAPIAASA